MQEGDLKEKDLHENVSLFYVLTRSIIIAFLFRM